MSQCLDCDNMTLVLWLSGLHLIRTAQSLFKNEDHKKNIRMHTLWYWRMHDIEWFRQYAMKLLWTNIEETKISHYVITSLLMSCLLFSNKVAVTTEHTSYKPVWSHIKCVRGHWFFFPNLCQWEQLLDSYLKKRHLKKKTKQKNNPKKRLSSASRSNPGFCLDERHACGAWAGLQMSSAHYFILLFLFTNFLILNRKLFIWVKAALVLL